MVCFDIFLAYPLHSREKRNVVFAARIKHLRRHYNVDETSSFSTDSTRYVRVSVCDDDAIGFLRDLPEPTYCVWIRFLRSNALFYANSKATGNWVVPPKELLLKRVYWLASSLEKWQASTVTSPMPRLSPQSKLE